MADLCICDIEIQEKYITVASIHTPNDEGPIFFQDFFTSIYFISSVKIKPFNP